jgi:threonine dehydrogenase-like Zn-dependent dehydrogenase
MMGQVAAARGASVTIADRDERRLEQAAAIGIVGATLSGDAMAAVAPSSFDIVFDAAGAPGMETDLIRLARQLGTVVLLAGRTTVSYGFNLGQQREITIRQSAHFDREELALAAQYLVDGRVVAEPLMDPVRDIGEAESIYATLVGAPESLGASVFRW